VVEHHPHLLAGAIGWLNWDREWPQGHMIAAGTPETLAVEPLQPPFCRSPEGQKTKQLSAVPAGRSIPLMAPCCEIYLFRSTTWRSRK
jgi:hypothetical protein